MTFPGFCDGAGGCGGFRSHKIGCPRGEFTKCPCGNGWAYPDVAKLCASQLELNELARKRVREPATAEGLLKHEVDKLRGLVDFGRVEVIKDPRGGVIAIAHDHDDIWKGGDGSMWHRAPNGDFSLIR